MKTLKKFAINFASLADGEHLFDYQIDNKFLKHFETALVQEAKIEVSLRLFKFLHSLELNFKIKGFVRTVCDVCADDFDLAIDGEEEIIVKIVKEIPTENNEYNVVYLQDQHHSIHIAEMLYELLMLSIPMRKVHPLDSNDQTTCNSEVLKYLEYDEDLDDDSSEDNNENPIWGELKKLK